MDNWSDDRPDELSGRVDAGFAKVDARFEKVEGEMKEGFKKVNERLANTPTRDEMNKGFAELRSSYTALNRTLIAGALAIIVALIGFHA